jgi:hypothetical protein
MKSKICSCLFGLMILFTDAYAQDKSIRLIVRVMIWASLMQAMRLW